MAGVEIVSYEPSRRGDFLALMRHVYPQGGWSEEEFEWWFEENPAGRFVLNLAVSDGRTVGAGAQSWARAMLDGQEQDVTITHHVMTGPEARGKGVFSALQLHNDEEAAAAGSSATLGFANSVSGPIFVDKLGWEHLCWLRIWARAKRPLRVVERRRTGRPPSGGVHGEVERFELRHAEIQQRAAGRADHLLKDAAWLNWRYGNSPRRYASFSTERGFAVVGWGVLHGLSAGIVCELAGADGVRLLRRCVQAVDAEIVIAAPNPGEYGTYVAAGFAPTPSAIRFIGRAFRAGTRLPRSRSRFRFTLGDTDVF